MMGKWQGDSLVICALAHITAITYRYVVISSANRLSNSPTCYPLASPRPLSCRGNSKASRRPFFFDNQQVRYILLLLFLL